METIKEMSLRRSGLGLHAETPNVEPTHDLSLEVSDSRKANTISFTFAAFRNLKVRVSTVSPEFYRFQDVKSKLINASLFTG